MFNAETYKQRRKILQEKVGAGLILMLGNDESPINYAKNLYPFRQDSSFLYYFGLDYPGLAAVIDIENQKEILFGDEHDIDDIVWNGIQPGIAEQAAKSGVEENHPMVKLYTILKEAQASRKAIHFLPPYRPENKIKILRFLNIRPDQVNLHASQEFTKAVINQREIKSDEEIVEIEKSIDLSIDIHIAAMNMAHPGMVEKEIAAKVNSMASQADCRTASSLVATTNGQILHNRFYGNQIKKGDLFVLDTGIETAMHYASDLATTFPVSKKFTSQQKEIYQACLAAQKAAIETIDTDVPFLDIHLAACRSIINSMKECGFMKGDTEEALVEGAHALFFPCGIGHMLGLDVHDMEDLGEIWVGHDGHQKSTQFGLKSLRLAKPLKPGHVFSIGTGIYFIPELISRWKAEKKFNDFVNWNKVEEYKEFGGVRNEENYQLTNIGYKRLGKSKPCTIPQIEEIRN